MQTINLTQGKVAIVDKLDFNEVNKHKWCYDSSNGYPVSRIKGERVRLHRFILKINSRKKFVDHINRNKLDNRRINLRVCDSFGNVRNRGLNKNNTTGYKGVTKVGKKWRAQFSLNYKLLWLGEFYTSQEAALVYNKKAKEIHGDYAYQNAI